MVKLCPGSDRNTRLYFVIKGRDREQYAPQTDVKRAGGWCEPVSEGAELAREPRARK
jgi:hypothetical protein